MRCGSLIPRFLLLSLVSVLPLRAAADEKWHTLTPQQAREKHGSKKEEQLQLFSDGSVQTALPAPGGSEVVLDFQCASRTTIRRIRVELLPDTRFPDSRLGRNPERKKLMMFAVDAWIPAEDGNLKPTLWESCEISRDFDDPNNTDGVHLIDAASDTGWLIPTEANADEAPYAVLTFPTVIVIPANGCFSVSFDVGGNQDLDTPARYRVSFSDE